jgi:NAD(P)H-flavin reductase
LDKQAFKFVLYASFARPEEVIGNHLLAGLQLICEKKGLKNFELVYRFSNQKPPRWDESFIERQLQIHHKNDIKRIWVCGPPVMNETFDKGLEIIGPRYGLTRHMYEVM